MAPPPHFLVFRVCPALPPPIFSRLKPTSPLEPPGDCGLHPLPQESPSLSAPGLEGGLVGAPSTPCRGTQVGAGGC